MGKYGFSWSWKRASGLTAARQRLSRSVGVPTTKAGLQRRAGKHLWALGLLSSPAQRTVDRDEPDDDDLPRLAPTKKQLAFAKSLGVNVPRGIGRYELSGLIDAALGKKPAKRSRGIGGFFNALVAAICYVLAIGLLIFAATSYFAMHETTPAAIGAGVAALFWIVGMRASRKSRA